MGVDAGTPPGLMEKIRGIAAAEVAKFMRSGFLRNASITGGGLSIRGGFIRLLFGDVALFYIGPVLPAAPDGTLQQGMLIRRSDGTLAMALYDSAPDDATAPNQAMTWWDRAGNVVFADDTDSGQGIARPYVPGVFYRSDYADWLAVTGTTFVTKFKARMPKQHPQLTVRAFASNDTSGGTGELRVLVNGVQLGSVLPTGFVISEFVFGPAPVAGAHMSTLTVELQARVVSGSGAVRVEPSRLEGRQT